MMVMKNFVLRITVTIVAACFTHHDHLLWYIECMLQWLFLRAWDGGYVEQKVSNVFVSTMIQNKMDPPCHEHDCASGECPSDDIIKCIMMNLDGADSIFVGGRDDPTIMMSSSIVMVVIPSTLNSYHQKYSRVSNSNPSKKTELLCIVLGGYLQFSVISHEGRGGRTRIVLLHENCRLFSSTCFFSCCVTHVTVRSSCFSFLLLCHGNNKLSAHV